MEKESGDETKHSRSLKFESEPKWWFPVDQQRTDNGEQMPQEQFKRVQKKIGPLQSQLAQETMRSKIRRMKMEKTFGEQGTLSQAVVRNCQRSSQRSRRQRRLRREPNTAEVKETSRAKSIRHEESNQIATVLNSFFQFLIQAHRLDRNRSGQEITKHVSTVSTKTVKVKEAKVFSKSEAEMVDVMDTLQRAISNVEKVPKNLTFLQKEIDTRNTNNATVALIKSFQRTVLQRTTEQITDVSRGNTAVFVFIDQFFLKLGTLTIIENANITVDTKFSVYLSVAKSTVKSKDRRDSIRS